MKKHKTQNLKWLWLSFMVIMLDQITKYLANHHLLFGQSVALMNHLNLALGHNRGAAFSFLDNTSSWQIVMFAGIAIAVSIFIVIWLLRLDPKERWMSLALSLIFAGAIGNLIDRVIHGYVIDFIDFYIQQWHWPAFNVADSAVCAGVVILVLKMLFSREEK